jgi:murein DD-endopeptidase MepM/ murein hydrolase activator NlpD
VARNLPRKRRRKSAKFRNSVRLGAVLAVLTGINVYVFVFRDDTAIRKVFQPSSTGKTLVDEKTGVVRQSIPESLGGPAVKAPAPAAQKKAGPALSSPGDPDGRVVEGKIGANDTLGTVLAREGFGAVAGNVIKGLGRVFDVKSIKPGDSYIVGFDSEGNPELFEYLASPVLRYIVTARNEHNEGRSDGVWQARKEEKALETRAVEASGLIESSLYESVHKAGESSALVSLLVDLFAWDINFYIDTHPGDHWKVVVEKQYLGGHFYKYGNLLAAEYGGKAGTFRAFHFNPSPGRGAGRYYDEKGQAVAKTMLKTPLRFVRISSKFDRKRLHPVLHTVRAHLGVDYAAPTGTPIWASASGRVVEAGMKRGSGNTVVISHSGGLATRYYHLSRFAKGLTVGKLVNQKEVIGYVGTTGLSTGPHLHFSVTRNGAFVDPAKLQITREAPVANRGAFLETIRPRIAALKSLAPVVAKN